MMSGNSTEDHYDRSQSRTHPHTKFTCALYIGQQGISRSRPTAKEEASLYEIGGFALTLRENFGLPDDFKATAPRYSVVLQRTRLPISLKEKFGVYISTLLPSM